MKQATEPTTDEDHLSRFHWNDLRITLLAIVLVAVTIGSGVGTARLVARSNRNSPIIHKIDANTLQTKRSARQSAETLARVKDCTDPAGVCYQRGQTAGQQFAAYLQDDIVVATFCGNRAGDVASIKACVIREFTKLHPELSTAVTPNMP